MGGKLLVRLCEYVLLAVMAIDLLYLFEARAWVEPNPYILIRELAILNLMIVYAIYRIVEIVIKRLRYRR